MGAAAPIVMGVISAAGTAYGIYSQQEAAQAQERAAADADRLAMQNAEFIEMEGERAIQLETEAQRETESTARARAAASGVGGESQDLYMTDLERKHTDALDWMRKSTETQAKITRYGGQMAYRSGMAGAQQTQAGAVGSGIDLVGDIYDIGKTENWWGG